MKPENYSEWTYQKLNAHLNELLRQVAETDRQGLPVEDLVTECERAIAMIDLLMEQHQGTDFYRGYWQARQIKDEPPVLPPGERASGERIDVLKRLETLVEIARRRKHLQEHKNSNAGDEALLVGQLEELGCAAGEPDVRFVELWEQHEFAWLTLQAVAVSADHLDSAVQSTFYGLSSLENTVVTTFAGDGVTGFSNAVGQLARFAGPAGICLNNGEFLVADSGNNMIRRITQVGLVTTFAGTGVAGDQIGPADQAQFAGPRGVCSDLFGNVYFGDFSSCNTIYKIDTNNLVSRFASAFGDCNHGPSLWQLEADPAGNIYIGRWASVQKIYTNGTVQGLAGPAACCVEGWAGNVGIGIDAATNIYAATGTTVFKILPDGTLLNFAGLVGGYSDGPRLDARFQGPQDVAFDVASNMFVTDFSRVRKIRPDGWVTTLAGTGITGYKNGRGSEAQFSYAAGLCLDTNGNIYVADYGNNCIRKISPDTANIGIADDWQRHYFGVTGIDPTADPDHDGMSNYAEFWAGTDPLNANSALVIDRGSLLNNDLIQIRWQTVAGKTYTIQYSADLMTWNALGESVIGDGGMATVTDQIAAQQADHRYYRILLANF